MSDKCHYITVRGVGRVLIPGCMAVAVSGDLLHCTCNAPPSYSEQIDKLQRENKRLKAEIKHLKALLDPQNNKDNKRKSP